MISAALFCVAAAAFETDSLSLPMDSSVKVDKGFDASNYVNSRRMRIPVRSEFRAGIWKKINVGLKTTVFKIQGQQHSYGPSMGASVTKWISPAFGVRVDGGFGYWVDNFDACRMNSVDVSASVLFNLMSYAGGFDTSRFCELSLVGGLGYNRLWKSHLDRYDVLSCLFGINVDMRVFDRVHLFVEPQVDVLFRAMSRTDNWKRHAVAFNSAVGVSYSFGQERPVEARDKRWFVSLIGGTQFQNSSRVFRTMTTGELLGMHLGIGAGCRYTDWFGLRFTAGYSENSWMKDFAGQIFKTEYMFMRVEGMFDVLGMNRKLKDNIFGLSILCGPEIGHMKKHDRQEVLADHYVGLAGGLNFSVKVHKMLALFVEPRFSLVPYSAECDVLDTQSINKNYYDGLLNFNVGFEILLP